MGKYMFTTRHIVGRVWKIVFPEQDTYIYNNQEGERTVVTILRRVQEGRAYLGIDFWYSHFYLVGEYGLPDFYKVTSYDEVADIHDEPKEVILVTEPEAVTTVKICKGVTSSTPTETTTYTTYMPTTYTTETTTETT